MQRRSRPPISRLALTVALTGTTLALVPAGPAGASPDRVRADGPLTIFASAPVPALVLADATARVQSVETGSGATVVTLHVEGLLPNRSYGAHAHTGPCTTTASVAGPHYQDQLDPVKPSTDPTYANPDNEIWLDLRTGPNGTGRAQARVDWQFRPAGARSVVIHARTTSTGAGGPGTAGTAGPRVACLTVPF